MRLILILILVACGLGFCGIKVYSFFSEKAEMTPESIKAERLARLEDTELQQPPAEVAAPAVTAATIAEIRDDGLLRSKELSQLSIGSYTFLNRVAPVAPGFLRAEDSRVVVETDQPSNSWVWMGSPLFTDQITTLARAFDKDQVEMDLEFVLVLIARDKLTSRGLSIFYEQNASFLDVLNLTGDAGSLRISSGGWGAQLDFGRSDSGVSLLSQPVIRCLDGNPWKFGTDTQVPIPRSEFVDGVLRQVIEYRPIGFGLEGVVRIVGKKVLLDVKQRNGSVTPAGTGPSNDAPIFQDQILETSLQMAWWEWSVLGGIQVDKEQTRKGLFRDSFQVTNDLLVIFVRPRLALDTPPRAVPVADLKGRHPLEDIPEGLLPEKGWEDFPDGIPVDLLPVPLK